jgi:hypothetical protein
MPNNLAPESARLIFTLSKPLCPVFCITMHMEAQTMAAEAEILPGGAKRYLFRPAEADACKCVYSGTEAQFAAYIVG